MGNPKSRRGIAEKTMRQMPLDMWIRFDTLLTASNLTRRQLAAFLREARKRKLVQRQLEENTYRPLWKRVSPIVNF